MGDDLGDIIKLLDCWTAPMVPEDIPHGDMPGDRIWITDEYVTKANTIYPRLLALMKSMVAVDGRNRVVIAVCGGSGVGKSTIASILSFYFNQSGIGCYALSGDNYPHRIPRYNDAERLHIFRESGLRGMVREGEYSRERYEKIRQWQKEGIDASKSFIDQYPWHASYIANGRSGLENYLGTNREIGFDEVENIVNQFKSGAKAIWLKRMGRTEDDLWYEQVDFSTTNVLIIEWTHGNSDNYKGVDIPVLLNSTPQETLAYRCARNRDGAADSPFTTMVLEIEQELLKQQAHKAKIILSKQGELLSFNEYQELMMKES